LTSNFLTLFLCFQGPAQTRSSVIFFV
jgi:hypothetical protein